MSGLISSLLIQLGIRSPDLPPPPTVLTEHPNEPTQNNQQFTTQSDYHCRQKSSGYAGAGSLHNPNFFTALPKEMDARSPPSTQSVTNSTPGSIQNMATEGSLALEGNSLVDSRDPDSTPHEAMTQQRAPQDTPSAMAIEDAQRSTSDSFDIVEPVQSSLPADDGMGILRSKIIAIRDLQLANAEKARMVHNLMTESYNTSRDHQHTAVTPISSPTPLPASLTGDSDAPEPKSPNSSYENVSHLTPEDVQPTYAPKVEPEIDESATIESPDGDMDTEELAEATLGCVHYHRNVKLQCHTCKKWYTCRFCHDEVEDHNLIRRNTENMLCMLCGHAQPAGQICRQCDEQTAQYYCDICKLWNNDSKKSIYHCDDCGICRIGQGLGKDFFHCQTCCVCLPMSIENTHRCIERSTQCDCPICGDYMFTSTETVVVMRCGHSIHSKCLTEYSRNSFRCPICSKTITNMESTFRNLDRTIESQPMPEEFKDTKGLVYCNDCGSKSVVKYHWLGLRCDLCESYNTAQLQLLHGDMSAQSTVGPDAPSRARSSSLIENDEPLSSSFAELGVNSTSIPPSRLSIPNVAERRPSTSYNITRGRAISPVVSNYFGLPPERESEKPSSMPLSGTPSRGVTNSDYGAFNFLSKKLTYPYGLFGGETKSTDPVPEAGKDDDDGDDGDSDGDDDDDDDDDDEFSDSVESFDSVGSHGNEDDGEDDDHIAIFGHR
ncbi:unnamed protein product [Penicillium salamii]|uniref:Uncharacterized protein n=1 Tax=Penicillium salamii TaxID=1612424 RepID=A0A9W4ISB7_9EURO|nr:unnamed protein product [Penicillium salamii]CAG8334281.1 unnamed protein product [Penicillium salamii]CAG8358882.1 unnamed protein product [Penicillium salamii]CAG8369472.1 unnamed protein product [Penicillium salamii]